MAPVARTRAIARSARDLIRIGELYRNGGEYDGRQIIPRDWIAESWRLRSRARGRDGYGLGWFGRTERGHEVRFAWGYGGQFLFIVPALELTVAFTSDPVSPREGEHNAAIHRIVDQLLIPAAMVGAQDSHWSATYQDEPQSPGALARGVLAGFSSH